MRVEPAKAHSAVSVSMDANQSIAALVRVSTPTDTII
jgi:hypothetical protein